MTFNENEEESKCRIEKKEEEGKKVNIEDKISEGRGRKTNICDSRGWMNWYSEKNRRREVLKEWGKE